MARPIRGRSEGVRKAYAAQRLENVSLAIAIVFTVTGMALILLAVFTPPPQDSALLSLRALLCSLGGFPSPRFNLDASQFYRGAFLLNPLFYLGGLLLALGFLAFRTTVAWEIAKQGPRLPRRIRLPFDSTVEIGVSVNQVQQRTGMTVGDHRGKDDCAEC